MEPENLPLEEEIPNMKIIIFPCQQHRYPRHDDLPRPFPLGVRRPAPCECPNCDDLSVVKELHLERYQYPFASELLQIPHGAFGGTGLGPYLGYIASFEGDMLVFRGIYTLFYF